MIRAGIDIGSRTVKLALVEGNRILLTRIENNTHDPLSVCANIVSGLEYDAITATGYGRYLFKAHFESEVISEIKAFALGIKHFCPSCRTVLDIGGQDTKVISIDENGKINRFEMNDKCAAGTGRFLEVMASALGFSLAEFVNAGLSTDKVVNINSMCTVFAESEVVSMIARGANRAEVARGIHQTIVKRAASMLKRIPVVDDISFLGGVALNSCARELLEKELARNVRVPENPQVVGAVGCAVDK
ncbi:MAG: acyl-CoA dehydratase activase [Spirochaetes bacterium]|jgi:predicted CoA-substrate-specific enzyme activase|nr:acyl-CoA dehydratase activase [Spirochaetota bacterium]